METIETLWSKMPQIPTHLTHIRPIKQRIIGTAFFPGGMGLFPGDGSFAHQLPKPVMVLGHDFDTVDGFNTSHKCGSENLEGPTWGNLLSLLKANHLPPQQCFFTNFFMGLRVSQKNTGPNPGRSDAAYVDSCRAFLLEQMRTTQPKLLLVLGTHVPSLIAPMAEELNAWDQATTTSIFNKDVALVKNPRFGDGISVRAAVSLTHPSLRPANLWRRGGSLAEGHEFECRIIREAKVHCELK